MYDVIEYQSNAYVCVCLRTGHTHREKYYCCPTRMQKKDYYASKENRSFDIINISSNYSLYSLLYPR